MEVHLATLSVLIADRDDNVTILTSSPSTLQLLLKHFISIYILHKIHFIVKIFHLYNALDKNLSHPSLGKGKIYSSTVFWL